MLAWSGQQCQHQNMICLYMSCCLLKGAPKSYQYNFHPQTGNAVPWFCLHRHDLSEQALLKKPGIPKKDCRQLAEGGDRSKRFESSFFCLSKEQIKKGEVMFQLRLLLQHLKQLLGIIAWSYLKTLTATLRCGRMWPLHMMWVVQHPCVHRMHVLNKILLHGLLLSGIHWKLELNWPGQHHDYPGHFHHNRGRHASAWLQQNRGAQCAECIKISFKPGKLPVDFVSRE